MATAKQFFDLWTRDKKLRAAELTRHRKPTHYVPKRVIRRQIRKAGL